MPSPRLIVLSILATVSLATHARAQEWGTILRGTFGPTTGITRDSGVVNRFGTTGTGASQRATLGAGMVCRFKPWLVLDLALTGGSESFTSDRYTVPVFDSTSARDIATLREFNVAATTFDVELAARAPLPLGNGWSIAPGVWGGLRLFGEATVRERIITPDSVRFADGAQERTAADETEIARQRFRLGLLAELELPFQVRLFDLGRVRPALETRLDLGSILAGDNVRHATALGLNATLLFEASEPPRDTIPPPPPRDTLPPLAVSLGMTAEGAIPAPALARPEREQVRTVIPWPLVTGFAPGSAALPACYTHNARSTRRPLSMGSLAQKGPDTAASAMLDILRLRHEAEPDATIRLIGRARNDTKLARARAERVRRYLVESAGIDPSALRVEIAVDSVVEGVEIASERSAITEPIVVEWEVRRLRAPTILIHPILNRRDGIRTWQLRIERDGRTLLEESGTGAPPAAWSQRLPLYNLLDPEPLPPLAATLRLTGEDGSVHPASATLPVGIAREWDTTGYARRTVVLSLPADGAAHSARVEARRRALTLAASLAGDGALLRGDRTVREALLPLFPTGTTIRTSEDAINEEYRSREWETVVLEQRSEPDR